MIRRKILYILILAACIWLVMLYTFQGLRFLLCILLVLPAVCMVLLLIKALGCRVVTGEIPASVTRGEEINFPVTVVYRGILPLAGLRLGIRWAAYGGRPVKVRRELWGVGCRCEKKIELTFDTGHCGQAEVKVAKARIYDCLGLFSVPVKKSGSAVVMITPVITPVQENEAALIRSYLRMQGAERDGDYFVREYRPGDSPRSIHWKLTAKADEPQVKDFQPDKAVNLFLNLSDSMLEQADARDAFLDKACSLMAFLAETAADGFFVSWVQDGALRSTRIDTAEALGLCIRELTGIQRTGAGLPEEDLSGEMQGCRLETDGRLYLGEQCAYEE